MDGNSGNSSALRNVVLETGVVPIILVVAVLLLFLFWIECRHVKKNNSSIFDLFFFGVIGMFFWGRLSYMIANWQEYSEIPWFYLPYEKYGTQIYFFRLLPWRFFVVGDSGVLLSGMMMAFLLCAILYVTYIKRWGWHEMLRPTMLLISLINAIVLILVGAFIPDWEGGILIGILLCLSFVIASIKYIVVDREKTFFIDLFISLFTLFAVGGSFFVIPAKGDVAMRYINFGVYLASSIILLILFYWDGRRARRDAATPVEVEISKKPSSPSPNKAIKIGNAI